MISKKKEKSDRFAVALLSFVLPISRILSMWLPTLCNHVSGRIVTSTLKRHFRIATDTVLHTRKDLAVSILPFDKHIPEGILVFRHWRHCSHLYDCSRRVLPATIPITL